MEKTAKLVLKAVQSIDKSAFELQEALWDERPSDFIDKRMRLDLEQSVERINKILQLL